MYRRSPGGGYAPFARARHPQYATTRSFFSSLLDVVSKKVVQPEPWRLVGKG
jgi:hypothetical protein